MSEGKTKELIPLMETATRVSVQCLGKEENGASVVVDILELIQYHDTNKLKLPFGCSAVQALEVLNCVMRVLERQAIAELEANPYSRMQ